ncbi:MAG TPA: twin-arginine translocase TatA/TatE family subunit [Anaeromyxobacter sp.]|nr:twin-arginine translocase TatA/TatE family subunit [Anaeromyxobacter sp.]
MFEGIFRGEHLLIILVIVLLVFPNKVANLGGSLGKTIRDFKKAMSEPDHEANKPTSPKNLPETKDG